MIFRGLLFFSVLVCLVGTANTALADVPDSINYQGVLLDSAGDPVTTTVSVAFTIYDHPTAGVSKWSETQPVTPDAEGRFSVQLGSVLPLTNTVFDEPDRFLEVQVSGDPPMTPRVPFVTVAYAHRVSTVDGSSGGTISGNVDIQSDLTVSGKATIGPGHTNSGNYAFIAGASNNVNRDYATVAGGSDNHVHGDFSAILGGRGNTITYDSSCIGGGVWNTASRLATIGGGRGNVAENESTVGGGIANFAGGTGATVSGGESNTADGGWPTIAGGLENTATGIMATVGGGWKNTATGNEAMVGGGYDNDAGGEEAAIGGGRANAASGKTSTVGGGYGNSASVEAATVGGGRANTASAYSATVAGGQSNHATDSCATVSGGRLNDATGVYATVGGGDDNTASGRYATVGGGYWCKATGAYSFAAGFGAWAEHEGSFVWSDGRAVSAFASTAEKQFSARCAGGVRFVTGYSGSTPTAGVEVAAGGTSWSAICDRNLKENFAPVDAVELLEKVAALPVMTWNGKAQDPSIRHIGPVAQDFYAAFGVGENNTHITTIDADGVALAAIQGLYQQNQDLKKRVEELEALVQQLLTKRE